MTIATDLHELKGKHRHIWSAGDYSQWARYIGSVGPDLVRLLSIAPGDRVLDVATGTGLAAIPAAHAGAIVTGLDLTPRLLASERRRAEAEDVQVTWVEGDAEALPFGDEAFDRVLSTFGVQFATRHRLAATEMARVCARGVALGLCNWTPRGLIGCLLKTSGATCPRRRPACPPRRPGATLLTLRSSWAIRSS